MIVAVDVHYRTHFAKVVSVEFDTWNTTTPSDIHEIQIDEFADYIPGQFYKRELPCILEVLKLTDLDKLEAIIIDGYVILDDQGKGGLGAYLYEALNEKIPIIGIAKRSFINNQKHVRQVLRGESKNPLYITSRGIDVDEAAKRISQMQGKYRLPDLIRIMDQKTKEK